MCGFVGAFGNSVAQAELSSGLSAISHRGPDSSGTFTQNSCSIAACVLRTVPGFGGRQPHLGTLGQALCFNGVIYNAELLAKKYLPNLSATESSDTDIVAALLSRVGIEVIGEFDGMFSLAWYDDPTITLARDIYGIKPLHYFFDESDGTLYFGSEIKAIRASLPRTDFHIGLIGLSEQLVFGFPLGDRNLLQETQSITPGRCMRFEYQPNTRSMKRTITSIRPETVVDSHASFGNSLDLSVKECMKSHGKIGILLSGGIDSALLATAIPEELRNQTTAIFLGYPGDFEEYAAHLAVTHSIGLKSSRVLYQDNTNLSAFESVFAVERPITFASSYVAGKHAASLGLRSVLSGDGADERFNGYRSARIPGGLAELYCKRLKQLAGLPSAIQSAVKEEIDRLAADQSHVMQFLESDQLANGQCDLTDKGTMYSSVECRLPFLRNNLRKSESLEIDLENGHQPIKTKPILKDELSKRYNYKISSQLLSLKKRAATSIQSNYRVEIQTYVDNLAKYKYFDSHPLGWIADRSLILKLDIFVQSFLLAGPRADKLEDLLDTRLNISKVYERDLFC